MMMIKTEEGAENVIDLINQSDPVALTVLNCGASSIPDVIGFK